MEWYKYADEETMVMVMNDSKQPLNVINILRKFTDQLEAKIMITDCAGGDMAVAWCCPHCGSLYDLTILVDFDDMNACCQYYFGKESFRLYRKKHASRA